MLPPIKNKLATGLVCEYEHVMHERLETLFYLPVAQQVFSEDMTDERLDMVINLAKVCA